MAWKNEQITGADLSGSDGTTNRTYTLANANSVQPGMSIIVDHTPLQVNVDYTKSGDTITFTGVIFDSQNITLDYQITAAVSTVTLPTTQELARFMNIEGVIPDMALVGESRAKETVGTGNNNTTVFWLDHAGVLDDTYTLSHGTSEPGTTDLTESTHYTLSKDNGKVTLTSTGVSTVTTNNIYAAYSFINMSHGQVLTDTQLQTALDQAQAEFENMTYNKWTDGTDDTPDYTQATNEKHTGKGRWDRNYYLKNFPLPNVSTDLNSGIDDDDTTIIVDSTSGFPSSGTLTIETEKITYTGKSSTTFTGCSRGSGDSTAASHSDGETVYPWCFEVSSTDPGSSPTWNVLEHDVDYDLDLNRGRVHVYWDDVILDTLSTTTYPPQMIPNRFRGTYIWGNSTIPNDVKKAVLMIAAKNLVHTTFRKSNLDGTDHGQKVSQLANIDNDWIMSVIERYRNIKVSNI